MKSPVQTVMVRTGDFFVGESATKPCGAWSCREKAIGVWNIRFEVV